MIGKLLHFLNSSFPGLHLFKKKMAIRMTTNNSHLLTNLISISTNKINSEWANKIIL